MGVANLLLLMCLVPAVLSSIGRLLTHRMSFLTFDEQLALCFPLGAAVGGLVALVLFWLGVPLPAVTAIMVTGGALGIIFRRPRFDEYRWVAGLFGFGLWTLSLQWPLLAFGGGAWAVDWAAHYHRALWFLERMPGAHVPLGLNIYVPTRPPLVNVLAAALVSIGSHEFWAYQVVMGMLHAILLGPVYLLLRRSRPNRAPARCWWIALAVPAFCPLFIRNATFLWTKVPAAALSLLAIYLYLTGRSPHHGKRVVLGFTIAALAILAHYSSALVAVPLAVDFMILTLGDRRVRQRTFWESAATASVILGLWLGFAVSVFGFSATLKAPLLTTSFSSLSLADRVQTAVTNLRYSLVPYWLSGLQDTGPLRPESPSFEFARSIPRSDLPSNFQVSISTDQQGRRRISLYGLFTQGRQDGLWSERWLVAHSGWLPGAIGLGSALYLLCVSVRATRGWIQRGCRVSTPPLGSDAMFWLGFAPLFSVGALASTAIAHQWGIVHIGMTAIVIWLFTLAMGKLLDVERPWCDLLLGIQGIEALGVFIAAHTLFAQYASSTSDFSSLVLGAFQLKEQAIGSPFLAERFGGGMIATAAAISGWLLATLVLRGSIRQGQGRQILTGC